MASRDAYNAKRRERYRFLRSLNFTAAEARTLRQRSGGRIERAIDEREFEIEAERPSSLANRQLAQLDQIAQYKRRKRQDPGAQRAVYETKRERRRNWRIWSGRKEFPPEMQSWINSVNKSNPPYRKGKVNPFSSKGYRALYHRYVNRRPEAEARRLGEKNDT